MRALTEAELNLIAGGNTSSSEIVVTGYRLSYDSADSSWYTYELDSSGGETREEEAEEPNDTSCVETTLASGVSTTDANRAALAASTAIQGSPNYGSHEYSSIVWALNGEVGFTVPYTDGHPDRVALNGGIDGVPDGAVIIGIVHSHPDDPVVDDRMPSPDDWDAYDQMLGYNAPRGITVDSNLLFYIVSDEGTPDEDGLDKVRPYDNTDKNMESGVSCFL